MRLGLGLGDVEIRRRARLSERLLLLEQNLIHRNLGELALDHRLLQVVLLVVALVL